MRHYLQFVLFGSLLALLGATTANASAIYKWHSTSPGPYVTATGGELVITNAAYFSGSIDFYVLDFSRDPQTSPWVQYGGPFPDYRILNSPVISASLDIELTDGGWAPGVSSQPGSLYFTEMQLPFTATLTFNNDGTLSGDLFLYNISDEASAAGTHYNWSVFDYGSDYFDDEQCGPPTCSGGSGYWQLASVSVPEPPAWTLFGCGVLGLFSLLAIRRKTQHGSQSITCPDSWQRGGRSLEWLHWLNPAERPVIIQGTATQLNQLAANGK